MLRIVLFILLFISLAVAAAKSSLTGRFVHVTDFHLDPYYKPGTDVKHRCHRHEDDGKYGDDDDDDDSDSDEDDNDDEDDDDDNSLVPGPLGAVGTKCDSPPALIDLTFDFIKTKLQDVDFVIYTGDSARHDRDEDLPRTLDEVMSAQKTIVKYFEESYSNSSIKILPVIGNNDVHPHNSASANDKQYGMIQDIWEPFGLNITRDFAYGGYFMQDVIPGKIRTIHTNTMLFYNDNDGDTAKCDQSDSAGALHLKWLHRVLEDSRSIGYRVYILAHIPPHTKKDKSYYSDTCLEGYFQLLADYKETIAAHFAGHYNRDILSVVYRDKDGNIEQAGAVTKKKRAISKADLERGDFIIPCFNSPSIIPAVNPAIRVFEYETDGDKYPIGTIRDWYQYYVNLSGTNNGRDGKVDFQLEYQASKIFNIDHFDADGMQTVFQGIRTDNHLVQMYDQHMSVSTKLDDDNDDDE